MELHKSARTLHPQMLLVATRTSHICEFAKSQERKQTSFSGLRKSAEPLCDILSKLASKMKKLQFLTLIFLLLFSCNSDKISEKSIELNNKAINSITAEKYPYALKYSEEAINADEKNYNAYTIKAQMLIKENKLNEAEKTIQEQLKVKPNFCGRLDF